MKIRSSLRQAIHKKGAVLCCSFEVARYLREADESCFTVYTRKFLKKDDPKYELCVCVHMCVMSIF